MKAIRIFGRSIRDAFKSVFRNFSLSMASILCATITLIVVSASLIVAGNVENATKELKSELSIVVYLEKGTTKEDIDNVINIIKSNNKVKDAESKSKEEWKLEISEYNASFKTIFENYDENPLLDSIVVTVKDVNDLESVTKDIKQIEKVDDANYGEDTVRNLISVFNVIEKVTLVVVVALVFVTAFLITNTIKLTIYSRREEIEIMRLVGASNIAIKLPFVIEGFVIGLLGSIIPIILSVYGYIIVNARLHGHLLTELIPLISPYPFIFYISVLIIILGSLIGMIGSLNAVRKYLKI